MGRCGTSLGILCRHTSILSKCGIKHTDSDVATAIRTCVVPAFAWAMAGISGSIETIDSIPAKAWLFLASRDLPPAHRGSVTLRPSASATLTRSKSVDKMSTVLAALIAIVLLAKQATWQLGSRGPPSSRSARF